MIPNDNAELAAILAQGRADAKAQDPDYYAQRELEAKVLESRKIIQQLAANAPKRASKALSKKATLALLRNANDQYKEAGLGIHHDTAQAEQEAAAEAAAQAAPAVGSQLAAPAASAPAFPAARSIDPADPLTSALASSGGSLGFSVGGTGPDSHDLGVSTFTRAQRDAANARGEFSDATGDLKQAAQGSELGLMQQLDTETAKNSELSTASREQAEETARNATRQAEIQAQAKQEIEPQMARIRQASSEAANAQMRNFWADKSTGARILGIISQALAGAANGLAGQPGAPTPLDRVIERDLEMQRVNLNNKVTTSYREQGILGLMQSKFKNEADAEAAAHMAVIQHIAAKVQDMNQRYKTPEAAAATTQAIADLKTKLAQVDQNTAHQKEQSAIQRMQIAAPMIRTSEAISGQIEAAKVRGQARSDDQHIMGLKGPVNKQVFQQLAKPATAVSEVVSSLGAYDRLLDPNASLDKSWYTSVRGLESTLEANLRQLQGTGAALSPVEYENIKKLIPNFSVGVLGKISNNQILDAKKAVRIIRSTIVRGYAAHVRGVSNSDYDLADPVIGGDLQGLASGGN